MREVGLSDLSRVYKERDKESRKYDSGMVVVIGGSDFYSAPPALSAMAALRAGADVVRIIAPRRAADIIASFGPDTSCYPLNGSYLTKRHLSTLVSMTEAAKNIARGNLSVVLGGGVGRTEETQRVIVDYLSKISVPVVIDADAIYAIMRAPDVVKGAIITPDYTEFLQLTGRDVYELPLEEKVEVVREEAEKLGATILLKGSVDIISDGKEVVLNKIGSPYLTVSGCGDTLSGIAGTLVAREALSSVDAASIAAYINVAAGLLAAEKLRDAMTPMNLVDEISQVIVNNFKRDGKES